MALTNVDLDRIDGNSGLLANVSTSALNGGPLAGARNRIINGDMRIDQRNAGASVTVNALSSYFAADRWQGTGQGSDGVFTMQQASDGPTVAQAGTKFYNSLKITVTTADASIGSAQRYYFQHKVEGFNWADLGFGSANASAVTLSFWVKSSVTGTFGGSLQNGAPDRSYPFTYSISSANTWEYKTITIPGDTTGTWSVNNDAGCRLTFSMGSGSTLLGTPGAWASGNYEGATGQTNLISTLNATWNITGVQLEAGTVATPFERRSHGQELALCQRYCYRWKYPHRDAIFLFIREANLTTFYGPPINFPVVMRQINSVTFLDSSTWNVVSGAVQTITPGAQFNSSVTEVSSFHLYFTWSGSSGSWDITNIRSNQNTPSLLPKIIVDGEL